MTPAFSYAGAEADAEILFVQRRSEAAEIFFVNNRKDRSEANEARFRNNFDQPNSAGRKPASAKCSHIAKTDQTR